MTTTALSTSASNEVLDRIVTRGDISQLTPTDRLVYYRSMCERIGVDPLTQPFQFLTLSGKQVLYATKSCTEQLRVIHGISVTDLSTSTTGDVFVVVAKVVNAKGRIDCATGAVSIANLKGDQLANALMKAETKAKRRATLSISGLGMLDESEIETIAGARIEPMPVAPVASTPRVEQMGAILDAGVESFTPTSVGVKVKNAKAKLEPKKPTIPNDALLVHRSCVVEHVATKSAVGQNGKPYTQHKIEWICDGAQYDGKTYSATIEETATRAKKDRDLVDIRYTIGQFGKVVETMTVLATSSAKEVSSDEDPF